MHGTDHFTPLLLTAAEREALFRWLTPAGITGPVAPSAAPPAPPPVRPTTPAPAPRTPTKRHV